MPVQVRSVDFVYCKSLGKISQAGVEDLIESGFGASVPRTEKMRLQGPKPGLQDMLQETEKLREVAIHEARRMFRPEGTLFWHGGKMNDVKCALENGFTVVHSEGRIGENGKIIAVDLVFMKKTAEEARRSAL